MRLLIDTHIAIWIVNDDDRLSSEARRTIIEADVIFVSTASVWELSIKFSNRRDRRSDMPFSGYHAILRFEESGFELLPLEPLHVAAVGSLPWHHRDPFDRLLIAHALVEGMTFMTHDTLLKDYGDHVLLV